MENLQAKLGDVLTEVGKVVVGQDELKQHILIALLSEGHILIEGAPGLAKTLTVSSFAKTLGLEFQRIQFTPDLLPSDIIGARIYNPDTKNFEVKKGPIFSNIILADEINRAPSKVQSALLEAMQEGQVTIGDTTFPLPSPFMVLATQNPLEQEGTFPLPEAQLDRFLLHHTLEYPSYEEELHIIQEDANRKNIKLKKILSSEDIKELQESMNSIDIQESLYTYILDIVRATRDKEKYPELMYGASPRASIALLKSSYAKSLLENRSFILPEDIKLLAIPVLRHRIILSYEALAEDISADDIIKKILDNTSIV
ncbi:MoxR family ATPase [Candidatus Gracilibacteria bacterium]|nr:MoxR family ATPase [Candidatus Gracilibacteria bacterium]